MITVVVVDDSAAARRLIVHILSAQPDIAVVGEASDGASAVALIARVRPDVVTMDIQMPVMDGYDAARRVMEDTPTPIIMVSAHEPDAVRGSFRALDAGAVTVIAKPTAPKPASGAELIATVRAMAGLKVVRRRPQAPAVAIPPEPAASPDRIDVIAIGASTGGPPALASILRGLHRPLPVPMLVVQHIADGFDEGLVDWLDGLSSVEVRLGYDGQAPRAGQMIVAPNGLHMGVSAAGRIALRADDPVDGHRPAASYLFHSVASVWGSRALGVILSGIGRDGTSGLAVLHAAGGTVFAQDEATSVVFGMPKSAIDDGSVDRVLAASEVAAALTDACRAARPGFDDGH